MLKELCDLLFLVDPESIPETFELLIFETVFFVALLDPKDTLTLFYNLIHQVVNSICEHGSGGLGNKVI